MNLNNKSKSNSERLRPMLVQVTSNVGRHLNSLILCQLAKLISYWEIRGILGLLHNLGDGCRHTATAVAAWRSPRRGEIFMTAISSPRRHSSPFGDTHRHMATPIAIWRQASPRRDSRDNLITFCIQLVPMLSKRWQAGEIKKAKVEALQPYRHPRWLKELGVSSTHALTPSSDTTTTNSESDIEWTNKRLLK